MSKSVLISVCAASAIALSACGDTKTAQSTAPEPMPSTPSSTMPMAETRLVAVLSYADWCGSCKVLDPVVTSIQPAMEAKGVDFIVLDYTAKDDAAYFAQADAAGVGEAVRGAMDEKIKTGKLMLVKPGGAVVVGSITKADSAEDMNAKIMAAISA